MNKGGCDTLDEEVSPIELVVLFSAWSRISSFTSDPAERNR